MSPSQPAAEGACPLSLPLYLKQGTAQLHEEMERLVNLLQPDLSLTDYRQFLRRTYGFYRPLEAALTQVPDLDRACPDHRSRQKAPWLIDDLLVLGETAPTIENLPRCSDLPALNTSGQILGCLYVIEGSTLGGAILSRHVSNVLGLTPEFGCRFLSSYGDQRGAMWKQLGVFLGSVPQREWDAVLDASRDTFLQFRRWFEPAHSAA